MKNRLKLKGQAIRNFDILLQKFFKNIRFQTRKINFKTDSNQRDVKTALKTRVNRFEDTKLSKHKTALKTRIPVSKNLLANCYWYVSIIRGTAMP